MRFGRNVETHTPLSHVTLTLSHSELPSTNSLSSPWQMEESVQCDTTRRRHKLLAHLPASVRFQLCELVLSAVVSAAVLVPFKEEIAKRAQRRAAVGPRLLNAKEPFGIPVEC